MVAHEGCVAVQESFSPSETVFPCLMPVQQLLVVVGALPAAQLGLGHPKYLKIIFNAGLAKLPAVSFKIGHFQSRPGPLNWHGVNVLLHPENFCMGCQTGSWVIDGGRGTKEQQLVDSKKKDNKQLSRILDKTCKDRGVNPVSFMLRAVWISSINAMSALAKAS